MKFHEYGDPAGEKIILLHPMDITGEMMYEIIGSRLKGNYFVISPDMGGHGSETEDFISAEAEAQSLHNYLMENGYTDIKLIFGMSLGAVCAMHMLQYKDITFRNIYLDGTPLCKMDRLSSRMFTKTFEKRYKQFKKDRAYAVKYLSARYGKKLGEHMADSYAAMSKTTADNICKACTDGCAQPVEQEITGDMYFDWGELEISSSAGIRVAAGMYRNAHVLIREGFDHCQYMAANIDDYIGLVNSILR